MSQVTRLTAPAESKDKSTLRILSVEDDRDFFLLIKRSLKAAGLECSLVLVQNEREFRHSLDEGALDLILSDYALPAFDGLSALRIAREKAPEIPFIILSGTLGEEIGVHALKEGAADYVTKSNLARLPAAIHRALEEAVLRKERQKAELKIREQARLLDLAQDAILVRDLEDRVEYCNRGAERLYGWAQSEIVGRVTTDLFDRKDQAYVEARSRMLRDGEWSGELRQLNQRGSEVITASRWNLVRDSQGRPKSILSIATDVTSRRQLETQVRQGQKLEAIGQLAGGIAHDFNNILAAIMAFTTMAHEAVSDRPEVQSDLAEVSKSVMRARDLVRQILVFSRRQEQERQPVRLQPIVKETVRLLRSTLPAFIEVSSQIDEAAPMVEADPTQLYQVVMNLVARAKRTMGESFGIVTITLEESRLTESVCREQPGVKPGPAVLLSVGDSGRALTTEEIAHVFEPGFATKGDGNGSDPGLPVVHGIVTAHHGIIQVKSREGVGTTFHIWLPALPESIGASPSPNAFVPGRDLPMGSGQRILVVDNEEANCLAVRRLLERIGYQPIDFIAPLEALEAFRADPDGFDLVLADQCMPKMSGTQLTREILAIRPGIHCVLTTGQDDDELRAEARTSGVKQILAKPYTLPVLARELKRLLPS